MYIIIINNINFWAEPALSQWNNNHCFIGQLSKAGLHKWMLFRIFHTRSCERSQLPLPGRFLSRCCFTLCITMEVEPRIMKQYKCHHCCVYKNYRETMTEDEKNNNVWVIFQLTRRSWRCGKNDLFLFFGGASSSSLLPDTLWLHAFKKAFKVGTVTANSLPPHSIVKKVCTRSKNSQGI